MRQLRDEGPRSSARPARHSYEGDGNLEGITAFGPFSHQEHLTTAVKVTLSRLRAKLGDPPIIDTVAKSGYRIAAGR